MNITKITSLVMKRLHSNQRGVSSGEPALSVPPPPIVTPHDKSVFTILLVAAFLLPLFFFPYLNLTVELGKGIFVAVVAVLGMILWLVARLKDAQFIIPRSVLLASIGIIVLVFLLSALFSPAISVSLGGAIFELGTFSSIAFLAVITFLASIAFQSHQNVLRLYVAFLFSFIVVFLFQASRLLFGADFLSFGLFTERAASVVGKWNDLAIFFGFITILSLLTIALMPQKRMLKKWFSVALVLSLVFLAIINFSVVWFLIGMLALVIFVYNLSFGWRKLRRDEEMKERKFPVSAFGVLIISAVFFISGNSIGGFLAPLFNVSQIEVRPSWSATLDIARETFKESPLLGSGPNRFTQQWLLSKPDGVNNTIFWNTDFRSGVGLIPSYIITTGLVGALAWLVFLSLFLYRGFRSLFSISRESSRYFLFSSFILSLYLWVLLFVYVPSMAIVALTFFMTGVFIALSAHERLIRNFQFSYLGDPKVSFVAVLLLTILIIGSAISGYTLIRKSVALITLQKGRIAFNVEGNLDRAGEKIDRALSLSQTDTYYRAAAELNTARLNFILNDPDISTENARAQFQATLGKAIDSAQRAVQFDDTNYLNWLNLARVYAAIVPLNIDGAYENARQSFGRAASLNPKGPSIVFEQARLEITRGNTTEARDYINLAIEMKNNYTDAIFLLAQLEANEGNIEGAIASVERATLLVPNNTGIFFQLGLLKYNNADYDGSIPAFERAVTLTPNYSNAKYFLGLGYDKIGRNSDAILQFEDIVRLNPDHSEAERILSNLRDNRDPFADVVPPAELPEQRSGPPIEE